MPAVAATLPIRTAAQAGLPLRSLMYNDGNNFSPQLGLAYRPLGDASTVIRAGYGMYAQFSPGLLDRRRRSPWQSTENFILENANDDDSVPQSLRHHFHLHRNSVDQRSERQLPR